MPARIERTGERENGEHSGDGVEDEDDSEHCEGVGGKFRLTSRVEVGGGEVVAKPGCAALAIVREECRRVQNTEFDDRGLSETAKSRNAV